jgi:hypothetical protein
MSTTVTNAPGDSLLGQLQRGRGAAFLAARQMPRSSIWPLLNECIVRDPRLDRQVESRADFYAALVLETEMELNSLATHLGDNDDADESGRSTPLTLSTLGALARRNYRNAAALLGDYVRRGFWWDMALEELVSTREPDFWRELDAAVAERCLNDARAGERIAWWDRNEEPWKTWARTNARLNATIGMARKESGRPEPRDFPNLTVADVLRLAREERRHGWKLREIIAELVEPEHFEMLRAQVSVSEPERSMVALAGLAKLANPSMFDWLREFWSENSNMPGVLRHWAGRAMTSMPPSKTLPLAREWLEHPDWHFRTLAEDLMACHAGRDDVPRLRQAIGSALEDDEANIYRLCSLFEAFKHLPGIGRIPELELAFVEFRYSYGRARAAEAMFATDPKDFVQTYARECLWDCEESTRKFGCDTVNTEVAEVTERLRQLSNDGWEDPVVRDAAEKRLNR